MKWYKWKIWRIAWSNNIGDSIVDYDGTWTRKFINLWILRKRNS